MHILTKENYFRPGENMHIQLSEDFPDYIGVLHTHNYIEVVYVVSGNALHEIEGKTYNVKRGDLFVVNMNTPHVFHPKKDSTEPFCAYDLMFTPEFFDESLTGYKALEELNKSYMFYSLFNDGNEKTPYFSVSGDEYNMFGELFNKIYLEHKAREKGYIEIIRAYLLQLIITIFRMDRKTQDGLDKNNNSRVVRFINDYINSNFNAPISVNKLANQVFLHPDYLGRIYKKETGLTISRMIQKVRIDKACHYLVSTELNISDVARKCGFEDTKFFYNVFKRQIGVLPGEYRKKAKG